MLKVLTAEQMREVDRLTTERYGIPSILLMENAAHAVARVITEKLGGSVKGKSILILCGKGNNGGDGAALARVLWQQGAIVEVVLIGKVEDVKGDARANFEILREYSRSRDVPMEFNLSFDKGSCVVREFEDGEHFRKRYLPQGEPSIVVDALFGTGLNRPVDENIGQVIISRWFEERALRDSPFEVISIDLPSGVDADNEVLIGETVRADVTVSFTAPKVANLLGESGAMNGQLVVANIGTPQELVNERGSRLYMSEIEDALLWLHHTDFSHDSYKNKRGHALVIAGSEDYSGAAVLAGNAAMRSGVGLVTLAVPSAIRGEVAARALPDLIVRAFDDDEFDVKADATLIGCGLDANLAANEVMFRKIVADRTSPVIVDAGALEFIPRLIGSEVRADKDVREPIILTPHEGEFLRLLDPQRKNHPVDEASPPLLRKEGSLNEDRVAAVRNYSISNNVILVLKGERVLIGSPDGRVVVNPTGNSGLGKAGNGDTLAGILVGFVAQAAKMKIDVFETVVAAVYIAGMAGDMAEKKYGKRVMTASDVRECLVDVFNELEAI